MAWHEPLVLFGYLAALTRTLELCTGILISPQRQAALLAKQAAEVDVLTGGRLRFVIAAGWNDVEFEALGVDFAERGKIMEEQVVLMRRLWTEEVVTYEGKFHTVTAAGINPLPVQRPIPLWFGGQSARGAEAHRSPRRRLVPLLPVVRPGAAPEDLAAIHESARAAGRDPKQIGIEGAIYFADPRFESPDRAEAADRTSTSASSTRTGGRSSARPATGSPRPGPTSAPRRRASASRARSGAASRRGCARSATSRRPSGPTSESRAGYSPDFISSTTRAVGIGEEHEVDARVRPRVLEQRAATLDGFATTTSTSST